jgi:hypothetical protein
MRIVSKHMDIHACPLANFIINGSHLYSILPLIKDKRLNYIKYIHENMYDICILNRLKLLNVRHARHANSG